MLSLRCAVTTMDSQQSHSRARPKKSRPISLAQLNAGALESAANAITRPASPRLRSSQTSSSSSSNVASSASSSASSLSETSLALCLHYVNLSDFLSVARSCRRWYACCKGRLAWSEGRQRVRVQGSRDEMRELGSEAEGDNKPTVRNFNPIGMHQTSTAELIRANSKTSPAPSSAATAGAASSAPTPLIRLCSTPLLLNVRHLSYRFAYPSIRTSIADLDAYEMFATDVIAGRFPLCGLPNGALPFLASLALEDVTACSQVTLQSAFHSLGVQQHSYLRALKLVASPVLSATESARTLRAILEELPANLRNLQILHMPQRNLPEHLPLEPLLGLQRLETLVLDASFAKTAPRLQVIRSLSLHARLQHLSWPSWRAPHLGMLCDGIRQEDAASVAALVDPHDTELSSLALPDVAVLGLDDDENAVTTAASTTASSSSSSSLTSASFAFTSWTIDLDVRWSDFARFFSLSPSLFPALHTLSFVSPTNFASMVDHLPDALQSLPALTALRIQVAYYSLGSGFFTKLAACSLPRLRRFELDQISLVCVNHVASVHSVSGEDHRIELNPTDEHDVGSSGSLWSSFPALEDLALLHMSLPLPQGLAASMPGLKRLYLDDVVSGGRGGIGGTSPGMHEWMQEIAQLQQLQQLYVLHAAEVGVDAFVPLASCRSLERLSFCPLPGGSQASTHTHSSRVGPSLDWEHPSVRHFDSEDAVAPPSTKGMQRQPSSEARGQAAAARATSWTHTGFNALQRRQAALASMGSASEAASVARMQIEWREVNGTQRFLPALPPRQH